MIHEPYVDSLPYIVFGFDLFGFLFSVFLMIVSSCCYCLKRNSHLEYIFLAASSVGPIISIIIHIPYMAIAYLNDATYATSILIFYLITTFIVFGTFNSTFDAYKSAVIHFQPNGGQNDLQGFQGCLRNTILCFQRNRKWICLIAILVVTVLTLTLTVMTATMLVIIPITKAVTDASNRLMGFYQIVAILVGAYFVYWKFYKNQPSIDSVISERQGRFQNQARLLTEWDTLSKEERVKEFYAKFTDIIMNYIPSTGENQQQQIANQLLQIVHQQLKIASQTLEEAMQGHCTSS